MAVEWPSLMTTSKHCRTICADWRPGHAEPPL